MTYIYTHIQTVRNTSVCQRSGGIYSFLYQCLYGHRGSSANFTDI